jgi:uncharacterized protein
MNNFVFHVSDFLKSNIVERSDKDFKFDTGCKSSLFASLKADKISEDVLYVSGSIKGFVFLECSRCLFVYEHPIDIKIEREMNFLNDIVDAGDELRQTMILELPMRPLCSPDCEGICKDCPKKDKDCASCIVKGSNDSFLKCSLNDLLKKH